MRFAIDRSRMRHRIVRLLVLGLLSHAAPVAADSLPVEEFSPAFLGMYRKVMEIEPQIQRFARHYGVDVDLARAVCLYESGGNAGLASRAGAQGYFQVMPATYRELAVATNIEAGVKYLAQMVRQFGREDRAVAAYNGGPGRISRGGSLPLETVQYVIGVGHYRSVLKQFDEQLRRHALRIQLVSVQPGETWATIATRTGISEWELRLHNAFLAGRPLRTGSRVAYPMASRRDLFLATDTGAVYRTRHGDNYIKLATLLGVDVEALRAENGLWQVQTVPAGVWLRIPFAIDRENVVKMALHEPHTRTALPDSRVIHTVQRGETLTAIARRYATTIAAVRRSNQLTGSTIRAGQRLIIEIARVNQLD